MSGRLLLARSIRLTPGGRSAALVRRAGVRGYAQQQRGGKKPFGFRSEEEETRRKDDLRRSDARPKGKGDEDFLDTLLSALVFTLPIVFVTDWAHKRFFPEHYAKLEKEAEERKKAREEKRRVKKEIKEAKKASREQSVDGESFVEDKTEGAQDG